MCGRFAQSNIIKGTTDVVKSVIGKVENLDNYNISPGQEAAVIKKYKWESVGSCPMEYST